MLETTDDPMLKKPVGLGKMNLDQLREQCTQVATDFGVGQTLTHILKHAPEEVPKGPRTPQTHPEQTYCSCEGRAHFDSVHHAPAHETRHLSSTR